MANRTLEPLRYLLHLQHTQDVAEVVAAAVVPKLSAALREKAPAASIGVQTYVR